MDIGQEIVFIPSNTLVGLTLTTSIIVFGSVSGGHFNPAVSTGVFIVNGKYNEDLKTFLTMVVSQLLGAIIGFYSSLVPTSTY